MSETDAIYKQPTRAIIEDFANEIKEKKRKGAKPSKEVIAFRNELINNTERDVWEVPIEILRYRKDNGRISSDVISFERDYGIIKEKSKVAQKTLKDFLEGKDPEKTTELMNSIFHSGQREPAIITADGFLINGNRRKVAFENLFKAYKEEKYNWMKVVILPGINDEGGPPTFKEIEQIENRYQYQSEGKSEYYGFDRAISIRRKIDTGMTLDEQLRDDPNYFRLSEKDFRKAIKKHREDYLKPLECIDRYLQQLGRSDLYKTISTGITDREGRWQAFKDYSNHTWNKLADEKTRLKMGIQEDEIGEFEEIAFKIIRKRDFPELPKVHMLMRELPKWIQVEDAKEELFELLEINFDLSEEEIFDEDNKEYDERTKDKIWGAKHANKLIGSVKKARQLYKNEKESETPLSLLDAALKKLLHRNMDPGAVKLKDVPKARKYLKDIRNAADNLEHRFYQHNKSKKKK
ncbi:MAG: hypothetical protein FVQ83_05400 [Chloroflexi bacterium]|nr:hypothetical protein [Chloroflexota bacterium]